MNTLNKTDAEINTIINFIPFAVMWLDENLKIKNVNDLFLTIIKKSKEDVVGTDLSDYPFQNLQQFFSHIEFLKNRDICIIDNFKAVEEAKTVRFYVKEVEQEKSFLVLGIDQSRDVIRNTALEEVRQEQELNMRVSLVGQLASGVAHEINNPLTMISGLLHNMQKNLDLGFDKDFLLDKISKAAMNTERLAMIVKGLKFLARSDLNSPFEKVYLQELVDTSLEACATKFNSQNVEFTVENPIPEVILECRPHQLSHVLYSLLANAYEAVESVDKKWIKLVFETTDDHFIISVIDSGAGLDEENKNKIMKPFFTTKNKVKNVGLGLSTSKVIVQDHGANLIFDDASADTKFSVLFKKPSVVFLSPKF